MRSPTLVAALVLAIGGATVATAQIGDGPPEDPGAIAGEASAFGECVSEAAQAGAEDPQEACADLKPGGGGDESGPPEDTHPAACRDEPKEDGSFGKCVAEAASAFGRCVSEQAQTGGGNPTAACADLKPGNGGGNSENGEGDAGAGGTGGPPEGTPDGPPEGVPSGPPEGTPSGPPEGVPNGPPEGVPSGPPEGVPNGPPEGTPNGPPEGVPGGPPSG